MRRECRAGRRRPPDAHPARALLLRSRDLAARAGASVRSPLGLRSGAPTSSPPRATIGRCGSARRASSSSAARMAPSAPSSTSVATAGLSCARPTQGQTRTLQCRYHAWTYGLDGRLLRRPGPPGLGRVRPRRVRARAGRPRHLGRARVGQPRGGSAAARGAAPPPARRPARRCRPPHGLPDRHARGGPDRSSTRSAPTGRSSSRTSWSATTARRCTRSSCGSCRPSGAGRRRSTGSARAWPTTRSRSP